MILNKEINVEIRRVRKTNTENYEIHTYILQGINEATFKDIIKEQTVKNSKKYQSVVLAFDDINIVTEFSLGEIITKHQNRWHVVGNPLQIKNTKNDMMVQGWYERVELLKLMLSEIEPNFAYIIKLRKRDE